MKQFTILVQKELREAWRSFKFLWMPLLFIGLGISDPLVNYYMEDILGSVGNMPEGFSVVFPELKPIDLLVASTGQFQMIGLVVFVASVAGMISRERQNGTATLLYVRPVSATAIFMSKLMVASLLGMLSAVAGYAGSMYYTAILYGAVDAVGFLQMVGTYCVWLVAVSAICLMLSALFKTAVAMTIAMIGLPVGILIDSLIGQFWHVSPYKLANYGVQLIEDMPTYYVQTMAVTFVLVVVAIIVGILFTKRNAATTSI